ncbi:MAG: hypothetical protein GY759_20855 [Chloroflexi bacterium]|nr:hypothetical protein [Chloroflexota bacterium]
MYHRRFPWLAALIVIGLILMAGSAIYNNAWSEGFIMGQLATGQEGLILPQGAMVQGGSSFFGNLLGMMGIFLFFGFLLALVGVAFKFFGIRKWATADGPEGEKWAKHWHHHHGGPPPWRQGPWNPATGDEAQTETVAKPDPHAEPEMPPQAETKPQVEGAPKTDTTGSEA